MSNRSHTHYASIIAESWNCGQKKQAVSQFKEAIADHCNVKSLLAEIHELLPMVIWHTFTIHLISELY